MIRIKPAFIAPLASIMTLVLGAGFYTTLTTLDLTAKGIDKWIIGCVSSAYFCGLLISAFRSQHFILRVGHIRAFATFASIICVTTLLQGLYFSPTLWVVLRFFSGYGLAGIAVVVESWLMDGSDQRDRGTILAIYMFAYYLAQGISQLFLTYEYATDIEPYCLIAILSALSILPVCMTRFNAPCPEHPNILPFQYLLKRVPLGVWGCVCSGLILGPLYSLLPDYLHGAGKEDQQVALIMTAVILGGTLLQYPIGKLSDKFDRRRVLLGVSIISVLLFILFIPDFYATSWLASIGFFMGGATFTIYPLCISHTCDHIKQENMISAISTLLLAYGAGSAIGPLFSPIFTKLFGPNGLCFYLVVVGIIMILLVLRHLNSTYKHDEHVDYVAIPTTSPNAVPERNTELGSQEAEASVP